MTKEPKYPRRSGDGRLALRDPARLRLANSKLRERNRAMAYEYLGGKCVVCGETECSFEFDHIPGKGKEAEVTTLLTCSWERIKRELDRCQLVCVECHHELTAMRRKELLLHIPGVSVDEEEVPF